MKNSISFRLWGRYALFSQTTITFPHRRQLLFPQFLVDHSSPL